MNCLVLCHNNSYSDMNKSAREKEAVLSVFAELVRPLMRVAFEYGISASEIAGVVRRTYIQSLEARLADQKRATTDARIAVVAGLAKSDVTALRGSLPVPHLSSTRSGCKADRVDGSSLGECCLQLRTQLAASGAGACVLRASRGIRRTNFGSRARQIFGRCG